ncbi:MAG TPA: hypothetical protein VFQ56_01610, partial [Flavobacterium sp.]|nr:hypothetical protein [Flavobacterium sp.]
MQLSATALSRKPFGVIHMDTQDVIYSKIIEIMLEKSVDFFANLFGKPKNELVEPSANLKTGLSVHFNKSYLFSQNISLFKHSDSLDLKNNSIPLKIGNQDRRFYSLNLKKTLDETELLADDNHHILLGDPGAGKTTTLKRLVSKSYELLFSNSSETYKYSFPIVVRLSEIKATETLLIHLCHQLGIEYETIRKEIPFTETKEIYEEYYDTERNETFTRKKQVDVQKTRITYEYKIGTYPLKYAIGEYLNEMNCVIFLDGLDEINYQIKDAVFSEIKEISNGIRKSKIVLTSRYLQEIPSFKRFNINEINPLSDIQKKEIAKFWITDIDSFFIKLKELPYQDISDRPLFLTFLLRLFKANNDELPEQAVDVYRQIILLAIREWDYDKEQEIRRYSKYQTFNTYKKEDFLSELAFELTYTQNVKKIFTRNQLTIAYLNIYKGYPELGFEDKTDILRDIESQNGLIIESTGENFEFSHLSLQEYLCAKYILSIPISRKHIEL